jgi:hypothetical protein
MALLVSACGGSAAKGPDNDLATIELGHRPDGDDPTLAHIARQLDILEDTCTANTRTRLADFVANTMNIVEDKSAYSVTPVQVLDDAVTASDAYAASQSGTVDCLNMFVFLAMEYQGGQK